MQFEIVKTIWNASPSACFRLVENIHIHLDCSFLVIRDVTPLLLEEMVGCLAWQMSLGATCVNCLFVENRWFSKIRSDRKKTKFKNPQVIPDNYLGKFEKPKICKMQTFWLSSEITFTKTWLFGHNLSRLPRWFQDGQWCGLDFIDADQRLLEAPPGVMESREDESSKQYRRESIWISYMFICIWLENHIYIPTYVYMVYGVWTCSLKHAQQIHQNTMFTFKNHLLAYHLLYFGKKRRHGESINRLQALRPYLDKIAALEDGCHGICFQKKTGGLKEVIKCKKLP